MAYTNAISTYRETRVKTASQGQLIIMLYEEAVKHLDRSLELLKATAGSKRNPSNIEPVSNSVLKVQEIVTELTASLDFEQGGEIARNLFSLYNWFTRELLEANITQDIHRISAVRHQMNELKGAWVEVVAKTAAENAGKVTAGINIAG